MNRLSQRAMFSLVALAACVALLVRRSRSPAGETPLSRKAWLRAAGLAVGAISAAGWRARVLAATRPGAQLSPQISCILTPEETEGPYYIPREKFRANITERKPGTPLQLRLAVVDAASCRPIKGAYVDIWHCDAGGIYSGFIAASTGAGPGGPGGGPTDRATFLRGIQPTNGRGIATFETIYPGWYAGRTVHIHVKVHVGGNVVHTGQLFFADSLTDRVYRSVPYRARAAGRTTRNSNDSIYAGGGAQSTLSMKPNGHGGFIGSITLGVKKA